MRIDLKEALDMALARGGSEAPSLEYVADWAMKFSNFAQFVARIHLTGAKIHFDDELLLRYLQLVEHVFNDALAYAICMTAEAGQDIEVEIDAGPENLPVEIVAITKNQENQETKEYTIKTEFN